MKPGVQVGVKRCQEDWLWHSLWKASMIRKEDACPGRMAVSQAGGEVGAFRLRGAAMWQGLQQNSGSSSGNPTGLKATGSRTCRGEALGKREYRAQTKDSPWLWGVRKCSCQTAQYLQKGTLQLLGLTSSSSRNSEGGLLAVWGTGARVCWLEARLHYFILVSGFPGVGAGWREAGCLPTGSSSLPGLLLPSSGELFHRWAS